MRDYRQTPFKTMVILGESTVRGGPWVVASEYRFAGLVAELIQTVQNTPLHYVNSGIGANAIVSASTLFFRERISRREWAGMAVLALSILALVLAT